MGSLLAVTDTDVEIAREELLGKPSRARNRGRVLVHVEPQAEVRDERPLPRTAIVDRHHDLVVAVRTLQEAAIDLRQHRPRQRLALLRCTMDRQLELAEHRLPEERPVRELQRRAKIGELLLLGSWRSRSCAPAAGSR